MIVDFKEPLKQLLNEYAMNDAELATAMKKPNKSFEGLCKYITSVVTKANKNNSQAMYCRDEELVVLCLHYYQEDSLDFEPKKEEPKVETPTAKPTLKTVVNNVSKPKAKAKKVEDNSDDIFAGCDW